MRPIVLILSLTALLGGTLPVNAQVRSSRDSVHAIASWITSIERKKAELTAIVLDLPSSSTEGSQVALLRSGDAVRKVTTIYYGESGKATECYYVLDDQPRFFVRTESRYTHPASGRIKSQTVERVWLNKDSTFRWQDAHGGLTHSAAALKKKGDEVRRDFTALIGTTHEGSKSENRMPNVRCS